MKFWSTLQNRIPLGWLQLINEKGRLLVAIAGVGFADVLILMQLGFRSALYDSGVRFHNHLNADLVLISPQARNFWNMSSFTRRRLYQAQDLPGVESADALYTTLVTWRHPTTHKENSMLMLGFNPTRPIFTQTDINNQLDRVKLPNRVLFDRLTRGDYKILVNQLQQQQVTTEIEHHNFTIVGMFAAGAAFSTDGHLITSDQNFLRLFPRRQSASISLGVIRLKPGADVQQVKKALEFNLADDVMILTKAEFIEFEKDYWATKTPIGFIFRMGVAIGFGVGVVIVYQVLSSDVKAHLVEYATFKAMGYRDRYLLMIIFEESIILAILGFLPGFGVSALLYHLTRQITNLPLFLSFSRGIFVLLLTIIMCIISGIIATRKLQSADPADIFK